MCGRFTLISKPKVLSDLFKHEQKADFLPRYNIAPSQPIAIVRMANGQREFALVRWGLVPAWVKDPRGFSLLFNARGESALDKPSYRNAMRRRRCLVPADGFYEWRRAVDRKQPFYVRRADRQPMAFAGLWETWTGPNGEELETAAIVTTQANRTLAVLHERMPVIVPEAAFDLWLDTRAFDAETAATLIAPAPNDLLELYPVGQTANRTANDSADLIERVDPRTTPSAVAPDRQPRRRADRKPPEDDGQPSLF